MASITTVANQFFEACETGKDWQGCREYCMPNATLTAGRLKTLEQYTEWMKGLLTFIPDGGMS